MKVQDLMKSAPRVCRPGEGLDRAGRLMAEAGCGVLPVIADERRVIGMITDRDICCALAGADRKPSEMSVDDAMSAQVVTCSADESIASALGTMRTHKVRRLPVVDAGRHLVGLLALDDVALETRVYTPDAPAGPFDREIAATLKAIASHPALAPPDLVAGA